MIEDGLLEQNERRRFDKLMSEMFDSSPSHLPYDNAKVLTLWPQALGELQGYANYLENHHAATTADQIRLAVALADREFAKLGQPETRESRAIRSLRELVEHIDECDERDLLACDDDTHSPSVFSVLADRARDVIAKSVKKA